MNHTEDRSRALVMKDSRVELQTEANCINRVISRTLLFHYGDVIWWPFIYFFFYFWGSIYTQKPQDSIQHVSVDRASLCDFFSLHSYLTVEFTRHRLQEKTELLILSFYSMSVGNGEALRLHSDTHAALPQPAWSVNSHFPVFLHSGRMKSGNCCFTAALIAGITAFSSFPPLWEEENRQLLPYRRSHRRYQLQFPAFLHFDRRQTGSCSFTASLVGGKVDFPAFLLSQRRKTGNCSFTAAPIGGKVDFPVFLLCERRKTGSCSFTAALIGGKVGFPVFLRSERRKTGNCTYDAGTHGGNLSIRFCILSSLPVLVGGPWVGA